MVIYGAKQTIGPIDTSKSIQVAIEEPHLRVGDRISSEVFPQ